MAEKSASAEQARAESGSRARAPRGALPVSGVADRPPAPLLGLQQAVGNRALGRLLSGRALQAKLRVGPPGDAFEREADRVAEAVVGAGTVTGAPRISQVPADGPGGEVRRCARCGGAKGEEEPPAASAASGETVQRQCSCEKEEGDDDLLQGKLAGEPGRAPRVGAGLAARIAGLRGGGAPLPTALRTYFEPRFGQDFGAVRLHTGAAAERSAADLAARAFTVGNDVVFGAGEYAPESAGGRLLLAHELTHVVQQTPLVARRAPLVQRAAAEGAPPASPSAALEASSAEEAAAADPAVADPAAPASGPAAAPAASPVVEDEAASVGAGQMKKGEFLDRLEAEVRAAATAALAGTGHTTEDCPLLDFWLGYYRGQDAARINRDLPRMLPEGARAATAAELIPLVAARVGESVATWAKTGEVTGVPPGIPLAGMGMLAAGGASGAVAGLTSLLFKSRSGGPRGSGDPRSIRRELGAGRALDATLRSRMESAFGQSFSHVRVHDDARAAGLAEGLNARAFTLGPHVAFGGQEYRPGTIAGDALIAHELAHVVQQGGAAEEVAPFSLAGGETSALEADADAAAVGAVAALWGGVRGLAHGAGPALRSGLRLQRCKKKNASKTTPTTAPAKVGLTPEEFRAQLGANADQKKAMDALFADKTFLSLWDYLKNCPAQPRRNLGPLTLKVTPGLKIDGVERYGGYSPGSRTLEINPTKPEHLANPAELVDTVVHELIHAVDDLKEDCKDAGAGDPPLNGAGTQTSPKRAEVAGTPEEDRLMLDVGPGASNPCEEFIDINKAAQQMIIQILKNNIRVAKVGRPTITFVNEILRTNPQAMADYKKCRDAACAKSNKAERDKEMAACSADILARYMPAATAPNSGAGRQP